MKRIGVFFAILIGFVALALLPHARESWERIVLSGLAGGLLIVGGYWAGLGSAEKR